MTVGTGVGRGSRVRLTDEQRCSRNTTSTGKRCQNPHLPGVAVCYKHANNAPQIINKADRARTNNEIEARMRRFVTPLEPGDPRARGDNALDWQIRQTIPRIQMLDEWIMELREEELGWSRVAIEREVEDTEESMIGSFGNSDTTKAIKKRRQVHEARINVYVEWQMRERVHLANLTKIWLGAGFKQQELNMLERHAMAYNQGLVELVGALGHDMADPVVRLAIHKVMARMASTAPARAEVEA